MPIIQLSFDNPLNTSVQVGDNAYFSNPLPVSVPGNPLGGQWTSTTTPHMTNDIDGVVDLGEILTITPWDGTNSFITCDMDQVLFNKYFSQIQVPLCVPDASAVNILITDSVFQNGYQTSQDPSGLQLQIFNSTTDLLNAAFSPNNYNTPFVEIGKFSRSCNTLGGSVQIAAVNYGTFADNGIKHCDAGNGECWSKINNLSLAGLGPAGNPGLIPHSLMNFANAFDCLDHFINHDGWNLTLNSSFTDVVNEATAQGTYFPQAYGFPPCYCQDFPVVCSGNGSYIMFSKDNKANMSSILGYYASVEYRNSSQIKSELFNVGTDFFESSK